MTQKTKIQQEALSGSPQPNFTSFTPAPIISKRNPTTSDTGYNLGQVWVNKSSGTLFQLASVSAGSATWVNVAGGGGGSLSQLTPDSGGAVVAVGGNINVGGIGGNFTRNAGAGSLSIDNKRWTTQFVVDANAAPGSDAEYTTITAAVAAAGAAGGGQVFVRTGTYTENVTLPTGVGLLSYPSIPNVFGAQVGTLIDGTLTVSASGENYVSGLALTNSSGGPVLDFPGTNTLLLFMSYCTIFGGSVAAISCSNPNGNFLLDHLLVLAPTSDFINCTAGGPQFSNCQFPGLGGTAGLIFNGATASFDFGTSQIEGNFTLSNGSSGRLRNVSARSLTLSNNSNVECQFCDLNPNGAASCIVLNDTSQCNFSQGILNSSGAPTATIAAAARLTIDQSSVGSSGTPFAISGTGSLNYGILEFTNGTTDLDPGLSTNLFVVRPYSTSGNSFSAQRGLCSFDSTSFGVDTNGFVTLGGAIPNSFGTDSGTAIPIAGVINILAGVSTKNCGSSVEFTGTGSDIELQVSDAFNNVIVGKGSGNSSLTGASNVAFGVSAMTALTSGTENSAFGSGTLAALINGNGNCAFGTDTLGVLVSGGGNMSIGSGTLSNLTGGAFNVAIGFGAGINYTTTESSNILLLNEGVNAESNTIRIGIQGTGSTQQDRCFIAGINTASNNASAPVVVVDSSTGQLTKAAGIQTAPIDSSTATTAFGASLTTGTPMQNTLGYDILVNVSGMAIVGAPGTVVLGVGPTSPPSTNDVTPTLAGTGLVSFGAVVPNNYYVLVDVTGGVTIPAVVTQVCPI
jgi:hypothetical protein